MFAYGRLVIMGGYSSLEVESVKREQPGTFIKDGQCACSMQFRNFFRERVSFRFFQRCYRTVD